MVFVITIHAIHHFCGGSCTRTAEAAVKTSRVMDEELNSIGQEGPEGIPLCLADGDTYGNFRIYMLISNINACLVSTYRLTHQCNTPCERLTD